MKKVFTLFLAMTIVVAGFAQVKSVRPNMKQVKTAQKVTFTGMEERDYANFPTQPRNIVVTPDVEELAYTTYDWQSNMGPRNFTAVWPDGFAVMCYTLATDEGYSDRGTGLAIWDPEVGEWEYTEERAETMPTGITKTGFGAIARYKENGLVIAAHSADYCHLFICEDFRNGSRDFSTCITLPNDFGPCWPAVQCSGENLDIIHVVATEYNGTTPYKEAIRYYRYENGEWTASGQILELLDENHVSEGGSNTTCFLLCDPNKPNRVSFVMANAWSDGKVLVSEDNGTSWNEIMYYQHPGVNTTFADDVWFFYPRWVSAQFDENDKLNIVYEWNGSTGEPGSGSYYPSLGGIGFWSEDLPKSDIALGGIGEAGQPFIMDSTYLIQDFYSSTWYWSDALHEMLPECFGALEIIDAQGNVLPRDSEEGLFIDLNTRGDHGSYNGGHASFASMYRTGDRVFAFWSMICGDEAGTVYMDGSNHFYRLFCNMSTDGGRTWEGTQQVNTDVMTQYDENVYGQVIPYLYHDAEGEYLWYCYQNDGQTGTFVQGDEANSTDNCYKAAKVYISKYWGVDEESNTVAPAVTMNVYPNPANGSFYMELNNESDVNIINAVGQLVKSYKSVKSIVVNDLEAGIYFVKAGNQTQKVVVF